MSVKIPLLNSGFSGFEWVQVPARKHTRRGEHGLVSVRYMNLAYRYWEHTWHREGDARS